MGESKIARIPDAAEAASNSWLPAALPSALLQKPYEEHDASHAANDGQRGAREEGASISLTPGVRGRREGDFEVTVDRSSTSGAERRR